jgi:hypothetical protein
LVQVDRNRPEAVPFDRPADHEVERIRAAIERKKRIENERDTRRANGRND